MSTAREITDHYVDSQGWTTQTLLGLLLDFIDATGRAPQLDTFLDSVSSNEEDTYPE